MPPPPTTATSARPAATSADRDGRAGAAAAAGPSGLRGDNGGSADGSNADERNADGGDANGGGADRGDADRGDADRGDADREAADREAADRGDADEGDPNGGDADEGDANGGDADERDPDGGDANGGDADEGGADGGSADEGAGTEANTVRDRRCGGTAPAPGAAATTMRSRRSTSLAVSRVSGSCRSSPCSTGPSSPARSGRVGLLGGQRHQCGHRGLPGVRRTALDRGVERGAERPHVRLHGGRAVAGPLRRDVLRGADHQPGAGDRAVVDEGGQAEVGEHHPAVGADQHVVRLDVAVQHAGPVRGGQRVQHGEADPGGGDRRVGPVLVDHLVQGAGRHVLHHDPRQVLGVHDVVDPDHVRMVEPAGAARLTQRAVAQPGLLVVGHPVRRDELLDGDVPVEHLVAGQPDPAHAAGTDRLEQAIPTGDEHASDRHRAPTRRLDLQDRHAARGSGTAITRPPRRPRGCPYMTAGGDRKPRRT